MATDFQDLSFYLWLPLLLSRPFLLPLYERGTVWLFDSKASNDSSCSLISTLWDFFRDTYDTTESKCLLCKVFLNPFALL